MFDLADSLLEAIMNVGSSQTCTKLRMRRLCSDGLRIGEQDGQMDFWEADTVFLSITGDKVSVLDIQMRKIAGS